MTEDERSTVFERLTDLKSESPTLIEGLPGLGLVAAITVEQVTKQLNLDHYGNLYSDDFPPVASFENGRVRDTVRVYAGADPDVMTLQSDIAIPPQSFKSLSECVLGDLSSEFGRAIFLAGSTAENEGQIGNIFGVATTEEVRSDLVEAGVPIAEGTGLLSGVTGALVNECYHEGVPAAVLIVKANPYLPDPSAA
ncbi:MAG: PAC2 family protein, partial [Halobacteria archaeon]|nr:PAC2 family protein [Halobacteria archaeon]